MEPIIAPSTIYWLGVVDSINTSYFWLCFILFCNGVIQLVVFFNADDLTEERESFEETKAAQKKLERGSMRRLMLSISFIFIFIFGSIFTPTSKTIIAMEVARVVTVDNISKAIQAGKVLKDEVKSDVLDVINAIRGEEKKEKTK
jgi:hypothetical protein